MGIFAFMIYNAISHLLFLLLVILVVIYNQNLLQKRSTYKPNEQRKVNSYYPTKLAIHLLTSSAAQDHLSTYKQHFMLVEAGNRFVAYTSGCLREVWW